MISYLKILFMFATQFGPREFVHTQLHIVVVVELVACNAVVVDVVTQSAVVTLGTQCVHTNQQLYTSYNTS